MIDVVIDAIVGMGIEGAWDKIRHREAVVKVLKALKIDPGDPPDDFDAVYTRALIEYGVYKPQPVLRFFENEFIRNAFRESFYKNDVRILDREADEVIQWNMETAALGHIDYNPRREFAAFSAVFSEIVDRLRTPTDVRQDNKFEALFGTLNHTLEELRQRVELLGLDELRAEVLQLRQNHMARQFVFVASDKQLKVFISSGSTELSDARKSIAASLEARGIDVWLFDSQQIPRPAGVLEESFREIEAADLFVGLFDGQYHELSVAEYRHARKLRKPCFIFTAHGPRQARDAELEKFLSAEVRDPRNGVIPAEFLNTSDLSRQVADGVFGWLVRRHRELTSEIVTYRASRVAAEQLQVEIDRLQAASTIQLPQGTNLDFLAKQMREWFDVLGYRFEHYEQRAPDALDWIINIRVRPGRYDRIVVRVIDGEAEIKDVASLHASVTTQRADQGWLVAARRVSQAAREATKNDFTKITCYTFDELIDEEADFSEYLDWLAAYIQGKGIDKGYVTLACRKQEYDEAGKKRIGVSTYGVEDGGIDQYVDRWLDDPAKEHLSILGEFGTGKTWFALHYAWVSLQRYSEAKRRGVERPRLPLVIPLRDYAKAVSVQSLFSEFFFRKHEIRLPGYSAFELLNRMGKLVLIFDGFDEMAARIDRQQMVNNFWQIAEVVVPGSKIILTSRTEHFPDAQSSRELLSALLKASTSSLEGVGPQFEVLELEKLNDSQIRQILSYRASSKILNQIMSNDALLDLTRRPVMIELVLDALPDISAGKPIDMSRVYLYAIRRKMEQDIRAERTFSSLADKVYFLCELSWEMLSTEQMSLNYRLFPDRLRFLFGNRVQSQKDLDYWQYDMMGQTILIRNSDGDYTPAHRSLVEFFVAYKFAAELGILAPDFVEVAQQRSDIDKTLEPQLQTWSEYFRRNNNTEGAILPSTPLLSFIQEDEERLISTFALQPLSNAVVDLLEHMIVLNTDTVTHQLFTLLEQTSNHREAEHYLGGNTATVISLVAPSSLNNQSFSGINLNGVLWRQRELVGSRFIQCTIDRMQSLPETFRSCLFKETSLNNGQARDIVFDHCDIVETSLLNSAMVGDITFRFCHINDTSANGIRCGDVRYYVCNVKSMTMRHSQVGDIDFDGRLPLQFDLRESQIGDIKCTLFVEEMTTMLQAIVRVALGDSEQQEIAEQGLQWFESNGWNIREPINALWAGERDLVTLTGHKDPQDSLLVACTLKLMEANVSSVKYALEVFAEDIHATLTALINNYITTRGKIE